MSLSLNWENLLWEARGYLGLDDDEAVPRDELVDQAVANGYNDREVQQAIRATDQLELVGDLDNAHLRLAEGFATAEADETADPDDVAADDLCTTEEATEPPAPSNDSGWEDADFTTSTPGVYPEELLEREQWMGHVEKKPFAPWGNRDAPAPCTRDDHDADTAAECDCDARWKWGHTANYVDGETVAMAEDDPRLDGRAFLQQPDDPYAYVDGDDVRDPETGDVHPAFVAIIEHLGGTYADISTSGAGAHAIYRGELPDGVKQAAWQLDDEPWGANEDLPSIEIYPGKRVCVMTGDHVPGTPTEIREWNADVLDPLLEANDEVATAQRSDASTERDDYDLDDYEPSSTSSSETTTDIRDIFAALDRLDARRVADRTIVHSWTDSASTSDGYRAFSPTWGRGSNGTANIVDDEIWQDTGDLGGYGGPVVMALIDAGEMQPSKASPRAASGELWWKGIEHLRDLGFDIPEYDSSSAAPSSGPGGQYYDIESCAPPVLDRAPFDAEQRWGELEGERYDEFLEHEGPAVWGDDAGAGKTTNAARAAAKRERPHSVLFDKHEKAREFQKDSATPNGYYHLKGGEQMRESTCMDADHAGEECPTHPTGECPHMCPVYDLGSDHPARERYDALVAELGPVETHYLMGDELPGHDDDGHCQWLDQFSGAAKAEGVIGVHEYQILKTVQKMKSGDRRDVLVDEVPSSLRSQTEFGIEDLVRLGNALEGIGNYASTPDSLTKLSKFVDAVVDELTTGGSLENIDPPEITGESIEVEVDPENLPEGVDESDLRKTTKREYPGMYEEGHRKRTAYVIDRDLIAETLARAKLEYNDTILARMRDGSWNGEPLALDAVFAAAAGAGLPEVEARKAIAAPTTLDDCPRCGNDLHLINGAHVCEDGCGWDEEHDYIVSKDATPARADAYLDADLDGSRLVFEELPQSEDLPEAPLILDATTDTLRGAPGKIAALYGVNRDEVLVTGDDPLEPNAHITQVLDGQYHWSTISDTDTIRERVERTVQKLADVHDKLLIVGRKSAHTELDLPTEGVEWLHYHAARGLNRTECDAVVCIGAPHPAIPDLEREAELLTKGRDDIDVGGVEHSTRRDAPNPPVYRKLLYEDADGAGRAIPTKHYTGLVGELFREAREKELEQVVHRIRPLLADETKHAYLLTNVPTDLPVDEVCEFQELADPLGALLPVADGALELADAIHTAAEGERDGFRPSTLVEPIGTDRDGEELRFRVDAVHKLAVRHGLDVTERTVRRWIEDLEDVGLVDAGEYEQHRGVSYAVDLSTLTSALSVLTDNDGVEVAARRRFRALVAESDSAAEWLSRAKEVIGLVCDPDGVAPPPGDPV